MPWQEMSVMEQRYDLVHDLIQAVPREHSRVCRQYGVSRQTGYKWLKRFEAGGIAALADGSSRPHSSPDAVDADTRDLILAARRKHPKWGARKLRDWLTPRYPDAVFPAKSTIHEILTTAGLVRRRRRRSRSKHPGGVPFVAEQPNDLWTTDFKGEFKLRDGSWCYPLTVLDGVSRFGLGCVALEGPRFTLTKTAMTRVFRQYGLPWRMRMDNGAPFANIRSLARLSRLSVWWLQLGVTPETITPASPQENGRHERFHRTLKDHTVIPPSSGRRAQQRRFNNFMQEYNHERPHESLGGTPPSQHYHESSRSFPERIAPPAYPDQASVRTVSQGGWIRWQGQTVQLTTVLSGERVGLIEVDDGIWRMYYYGYQLADLDERTGTCTGVSRITPPTLSTRSPD